MHHIRIAISIDISTLAKTTITAAAATIIIVIIIFIVIIVVVIVYSLEFVVVIANRGPWCACLIKLCDRIESLR